MVDRSLRMGIALLLGLVGVVVSACSYQPEIYSAKARDDGTTVGLEMNNCHGDYSVSVVESADEVRVRVTDNRTPISLSGDDCSDVVTIELAEPLGDRRLVNDANGDPVSVRSVPSSGDPLEGSAWSGQDVADARAVWVNQLGLNRRDPGVWVARLNEICPAGRAVGMALMESLAERYLAEDAEVSARADGTMPQFEEVMATLRQIADSPICGVFDDPNAAEAWDPTAVMAPEAIVIDSTVVEPGTLLAVSFPDERTRGIHFVLEAVESDGTVTLTHHLISDWGGTHEPHSYAAGEMEGIGIPDVGITGPGSDTILIPAEATPGKYRICTGNARPNVCTTLTIR